MPYIWINIYTAPQHCTRMLKGLAPPAESKQSARQDQTWIRSWLRDKEQWSGRDEQFSKWEGAIWGCPQYTDCYFIRVRSGGRCTGRWQKWQVAQEITNLNSREGCEEFQKAFVTAYKCRLEEQQALGWVVSTIYSYNTGCVRGRGRNEGWKLG